MKAYLTRWRPWAILVLPVLVILLSCIGPDTWREPLVRMQYLSWTAIAVALAYSASKALFDYAEGHKVYTKAMETSQGAALVFLTLGITRTFLAVAFVYAAFAGNATGQPLPPGAHVLAPVMNQVMDDYWPDMPRRSYLGALIEKETCVTLTSKTCFTTLARLKTQREEGGGLGQITRAYNQNGTLRFDALAELRDADPKGLAELSWQTLYTRADLNVRAILVKLKACDRYFARTADLQDLERMAFCDAAYNGGQGGVMQDRKLCYLTKGCDPDKWFGHVEHTSNKSRVKWQGYGQSAFEINRAHVKATVPASPRRERYIPLLGV